jgi:hypothetical protein
MMRKVVFNIPAPSKYDCNFENGLCTWTQAQDDQFDWTLQTGRTGSANTGPSFDHTRGQNGKFSQFSHCLSELLYFFLMLEFSVFHK